jgi:Na+/proline symporter
MDRHNGRIFILSHLFIYFAAPVMFVGVIQAALCNRLGASAMVANAPAAAYMLAFFAPLIMASLIPYRHEQMAVMVPSMVTAASCAMVYLALFPKPRRVTSWNRGSWARKGLSSV